MPPSRGCFVHLLFDLDDGRHSAYPIYGSAANAVRDRTAFRKAELLADSSKQTASCWSVMNRHAGENSATDPNWPTAVDRPGFRISALACPVLLDIAAIDRH
jgi:hypothetical protein